MDDRKIPGRYTERRAAGSPIRGKVIRVTCETEIDRDSAGNIKSDDEIPARAEMRLKSDSFSTR